MKIITFGEHCIAHSVGNIFTSTIFGMRNVINSTVFFPTPDTENRAIIVSDHGFRADFSTLMTNLIPDLHTLASSDGFQCFPFYTYDEDGTNRRSENITDWVLAEFRTHYRDDTDHQMGHLPLQLRPLTPSNLS